MADRHHTPNVITRESQPQVKGRTRRVEMQRSVVHQKVGSCEVGSVIDLPVKLADSWLAYGVCVDADGEELRPGLSDDEAESGEGVQLVNADGSDRE